MKKQTKSPKKSQVSGRVPTELKQFVEEFSAVCGFSKSDVLSIALNKIEREYRKTGGVTISTAPSDKAVA